MRLHHPSTRSRQRIVWIWDTPSAGQRGGGGWKESCFKSTTSFVMTGTNLPVLPAHTTFIITYMTRVYSSKICLPPHRCVKYSPIVRLKTHAFKRMKPRTVWSKIPVNTLCDALWHLNCFFCGVINVCLRRPRGATHYCDLCVPCSRCLYTQLKAPLREQVSPCYSSLNPYRKPHPWCLLMSNVTMSHASCQHYSTHESCLMSQV